MPSNRRRFLRVGLVATAALGAAVAGAWRWIRGASKAAGDLSREECMEILVAGVGPVVGLPVELEHYRTLFGLRWDRIAESRHVYRSYAGRVEAVAHAEQERRFVDCDP